MDNTGLTVYVDIATEWNLKTDERIYNILANDVDIATEWNLKVSGGTLSNDGDSVDRSEEHTSELQSH